MNLIQILRNLSMIEPEAMTAADVRVLLREEMLPDHYRRALEYYALALETLEAVKR